MSHAKHLKEMERFITAELQRYGVRDFTSRPTTNGHRIISFEHDGQIKSLTISGSTDHMARLRNRSILRQMLEGRR